MLMCDVPHEGEMTMIHLSNVSGLLQLIDSIDRKDNIDIFIRGRVVIVVVGDGEVLARRAILDFPERRISCRIHHIKGLLRFQVHTGRGNQCQSALRDITIKRGPGRIGKLDEL